MFGSYYGPPPAHEKKGRHKEGEKRKKPATIKLKTQNNKTKRSYSSPRKII